MGKRAISVLVAGTFVLGACSGGSNNAAAKDTGSPTSTKPKSSSAAPRTTDTVPSATTSTSTPAYSFDDSVPPPRIINTGTDYAAIVKSLESYGNWLASYHPDPALIDLVLAQGTKQELFALDLNRLQAHKSRLIEELGKPSSYVILSSTPHAFSARVVEDVLTKKTVVAGGRVTSQIRFTEPTTYLALAVLVRGRWYLAAFDVQHPAKVRL